jgi:hypothetical protein
MPRWYTICMNIAPRSHLCRNSRCLFILRTSNRFSPRHSEVSTFRRLDVRPSYPLRFHALAHSFDVFCAHQKLNSFLSNRFCTLCKNHPGGGYPINNSIRKYRRFYPAKGGSSSPSSADLRSPLATHHSPLVTISFRINTCKSVSKQRTLTTFIINTYEKPRWRGVSC